MAESISKIEPAPIAKRLFAAIMDALVFIFLFFGLAAFPFTPIAEAGLGYKEINRAETNYFYASHLYVAQKVDDNGDIQIVEVKDFGADFSRYSSLTLYSTTSADPSFYIKRLYYYYHNFKTNTDIELPSVGGFDPIADYFVSPEYNEPINGVLPVNFYTSEWFSKNILDLENPASYFQIDSSNLDYVSSISVKEGVSNEDAISYLKNRVYDANAEFYYSSYISDLHVQKVRIQYFIFFVPFVISFAIFYILVPMLTKDGQTLGKLSMHLAVISNDGYAAKKRQILFREALLLIYISICGVVVGIGITSLAIMALGVLLAFIGTLIPKNKRSIFDYAAYTLVVDSIRSTWFKNKEDELRHKNEIEENMSKYKKYVPDNPNLIQVGSKIVDENYKVEPKKKKSKK